MAFQRGITDGAFDGFGQLLAIVVVEPNQARTTRQRNQDHQAGGQICGRPAHDARTRTPPEASRALTAGRDPTTPPRQHQDRGQQGDRGQERHADPDRQRHADRREHTEFGEAHSEEGDTDRRRGCDDHLADRDEPPLHGQVRISTPSRT